MKNISITFFLISVSFSVSNAQSKQATGQYIFSVYPKSAQAGKSVVLDVVGYNYLNQVISLYKDGMEYCYGYGDSDIPDPDDEGEGISYGTYTVFIPDSVKPGSYDVGTEETDDWLCEGCFTVVNSTNTVSENNRQSMLKVYPNPFNYKLELASDAPITGVVSIHDVLGREVLHETINAQKGKSLNTEFLISGVYTVLVRGQVGMVEKRFIVVKE